MKKCVETLENKIDDLFCESDLKIKDFENKNEVLNKENKILKKALKQFSIGSKSLNIIGSQIVNYNKNALGYKEMIEVKTYHCIIA